jgi:DNA-binding response OmpR family regulator
MEDLRRIYRQAVPGRIQALEAARTALAGDAAAHSDALAAIRRVAHSLRGSGGTYGFPDISAAAAALEEADDSALAARLDELVLLLRATTEGEDTPAQVLVVEDEPEQALLIRASLAGAGCTLAVVATAAEALAHVDRSRPSLILLDLLLPDLDGRALLLKLREHPATAETPVIVLSGKNTAQAKTECFSHGANGFVEKPFDPDMLAALVGAQLRARIREAPAARPTTRGARVLVVEDDDMVASVLKHRLTREGLQILHFSDGVEALEAVRTESIDLAILDVKVPGVDGFQLLSELRQRPDTARIPIIMLTAMGSEQDVLRGFQMGANDYIVKPFSPVEVVARVMRLLRS